MKSAIITGFPGQDACYLADMLLAKGYAVYGTINATIDMANIDYLDLLSKGLKLVQCDITDPIGVLNTIDAVKPTEFYNLAAQSSPANSWALNHVTAQTNAIGPLNCLDAIRRVSPTTKFFQAATAEIFGNSHVGGWQTEDTPCVPRNPYGTSKLFAYNTVRNFRDHYQLFACNGILYNHESPLRGTSFVTRKITKGVAQIISGNADKITLGDLSARRDWGHATEFVEAMWLMLQADMPQDYIIATGTKNSVADFCRVAFACVGIKDWQSYIDVDPRFVRAPEEEIVAKPNKIYNELGWRAKRSFEDLVATMVTADINRLTNS